MPCIAPISTKQPRVGVISALSIACGLVLTLFISVPADPVVQKALDQLFRMDYPAAEATILEGLPAASPARPYYAGTICLNRFLDWGDTAALARAERYWEDVDSRAFPAADPLD